MVLVDQLDLLAATMDKILDAVYRADADALVAHGRFLAEKFGHASAAVRWRSTGRSRHAPDPGAGRLRRRGPGAP